MSQMQNTSLKSVTSRMREGLSLIDVTFSLGIMAILIVALQPIISSARDVVTAYMSGAKILRVKAGFEEYILGNYQQLLTDTDSGPVAISVADLVDEDYVDESLVTGTGSGRQATTAIGQTLNFIVRKSGATGLQGMIVARGVTLDRSQANYVTKAIGFDGGVVSTTASDCTPLSAPCARGPKSTWVVPTADFAGSDTNAILPGDNDVVAISLFDESRQVSPYLYRYDIGNPEAQKMHANVDMSGQRIIAVDDIYLESRGLWLSQVAKTSYLVYADQVVQKPECPENAPKPQIQVAQQVWAPAANNYPVSSVQFWADEFDSYWVIRINVINQDGVTTPGPDRAVAQVQVGCF